MLLKFDPRTEHSAGIEAGLLGSIHPLMSFAMKGFLSNVIGSGGFLGTVKAVPPKKKKKNSP